MATNDYHFITDWRVEGSINEVADILKDAEDLPRWWPSVYIDVKTLEPGDVNGVGKVVDLYTKGWLPYTLRWQFRVTESTYPYGFSLEAWGDFIGRGTWTLAQDGEFVNITYDWRIRAEKPLLRSLSFLLKPFFSANHKWAMEKRGAGLKWERARRLAKTPEEAARIPAPPLATFSTTGRK